VIALTVLHSFIMWFSLQHNLVPIHFNFSWTYKDLQYNRFLIALSGTLAGCISKLAIDRVESGKRIERMEKEKSIAELTYLKAQINPHFLFNSLNSLYAQLEAGSKDTKTTLSALAELLRFQLYDCDTDLIPVHKEVEYLKNYFMLQSIRKENCFVEFECGEVPGKLEIAPLLLVPFIENAFKYVSDNDTSANFIKAVLRFDNNTLYFYCSNTVMPVKPADKQANKGIGLNNVVKRLQLIYGDQYELEAGIKEDIYVVDLKIRLK
jgi:two-component system LytT family sensor kinase